MLVRALLVRGSRKLQSSGVLQGQDCEVNVPSHLSRSGMMECPVNWEKGRKRYLAWCHGRMGIASEDPKGVKGSRRLNTLVEELESYLNWGITWAGNSRRVIISRCMGKTILPESCWAKVRSSRRVTGGLQPASCSAKRILSLRARIAKGWESAGVLDSKWAVKAMKLKRSRARHLELCRAIGNEFRGHQAFSRME